MAQQRQVKGYELRTELGTGGFGAVYRAYQPIVGREVAIKVILPRYANQPDFIRRFETEAQLVARLEHPHIVPLFDYWRDGEGAYLVMRYLRGGSLQHLIEQGPVAPERTIQLISQVASALALAHQNRVIHRDVKPQNIMLDEQGNAYLTDFGIARSGTNHDPDDETAFSGSPSYAAPEMITAGEITHYSDIYALGIVIYEMLTGSNALTGTFTDVIMKQLNDLLPPLPADLNLPAEVNDVIQKATAKEPQQRYADALTLARALQAAITGDTSPALPMENAGVRNPYKGLLAFTEADAGDFFGREELVAQLLARLQETPADAAPNYTRFLAVVGPSGSGKSSVVQAGLLPALRQGALPGSSGWYIVQIEPDDRPIANVREALLSIASQPIANLDERLRTDPGCLNDLIEQALGDQRGEMLFVIDNFEELFTLTEDEAERAQYASLLYNGVIAQRSHMRVIVMLRADYYDRPLFYEAFGALLQERTQLVLPLTRDEISRAIRVPAERAGLQVDRDLLEAVLADARDEPGALPLLQYALTETYDRREGRRLTASAYRATGGIYGALSQRAEEVYASLSDVPFASSEGGSARPLSERDIARQVFLRLVSLTETGYRRRRTARVELVQIHDPVAVNRVIDAFGAYRLLTFEGELGTREPKVEIAHEALIRVWQRMQAWLEESREDLRVEEALFSAAADWLAADRDTSYLLSGGRLARFEAWAADTTFTLTPDEQEYLRESVRMRQQRQAEEAARAQRELDMARQMADNSRRAANRLRALALVLLAGVVAMAALFFVARSAREQAEIARDVAARRADEARSLQTAFVAQVELQNGRTDLALALALEAANIADPPPAIGATLVQMAYTRSTRHIYRDHNSEVMAVAVHPSGAQVASGGGRYNPTQRAGDDTVIRVWDVATRQVLLRLEGHTATVWDLAYSPDGAILASSSADNTIRLWDASTGALLRTLEGHTATVRSIAFSPSGSLLISGSGSYSDGSRRPEDDFSVRLWRVATGEAICTMTPLNPLGSEVRSVAFNPTGTLAVSGSGAERSPLGDNVIVLWDVAACRERRRVYGHTHLVNAVSFTADGTRFISGSADNRLILWNLASGQPVRYLNGHTDWVTTLAVDTTGRFALSGGWDNSIILWDVEIGRSIYQYIGHGAPVQALAFGAGEGVFFSAAQDGVLREWDYDSPLLLRRFGRASNDVSNKALYSPDGSLLITTGADATIILYNAETGARLGALRGHASEIQSLMFSRDGQRVLSGDTSGVIILWDVATRREIRRYEGHTGGVWRVVFSPDESRLLSGSDDATLRLWDAATGAELHRFEENLSEIYTVAWAPDGRTFYAGTLNKEVVGWDAATLAEVARYTGHTSAPYTSAFSPDGRYLATGGYDNRIILWDTHTSTLAQQFYGHARTVASVAFMPDGQTLISASLDRTVRLWDVNTGAEKGRIDYGVALVDMAIRPDGMALALASSGELVTAHAFPITDIAQLRAWIAANREVNALSCEERELYQLSVCG
jgi:WD40 repeat protein